MLGLLALLFFALTGILMNHSEWFLSGEAIIREEHGTMDVKLLNLTTAQPSQSQPPDQLPMIASDDADFTLPDYTQCIDKLAVVELLRAEHQIKGAVSQLSADEYQCMVLFEAPGYSADVFIERSDGSYDVVETREGLLAIVTDLHKGSASGKAWPCVIDVAGLVMIVSALTGLFLLLATPRRRRTGLLAMLFGAATIVAIYLLLVP
jgi:hypothetical protein